MYRYDGLIKTTKIAPPNIVLTGVSSSVSIIGAGIIFLTYWRIPTIRNFTRRLLIYLTVADLLTAVGNLVGMVRYVVLYGDSDMATNMNVSNCSDRSMTDMANVCIAQSFVTIFSNMASFFWTFVIALHLWVTVTWATKKTEGHFFHVIYHVFSWTVPLVITTVVAAGNYLGEDYCFGTGVWCGIRSNLPGKTIEKLMYIADIAWELSSYTLAALFYILLKWDLYKKTLRRRKGIEHSRALTLHDVSNNLRAEDKNYMYIPLFLYCLKVWGILRFFLSTYLHAQTLNQDGVKAFMYFLLIMQSIGASAQATLNCIIFCFCDEGCRKHMKCVAWCCKTEPETDYLLEDSQRLKSRDTSRSTTTRFSKDR